MTFELAMVRLIKLAYNKPACHQGRLLHTTRRFFPAVAKTVASTHCTDLRGDGQAEWAWINAATENQPKEVTNPSTNRCRCSLTLLTWPTPLWLAPNQPPENGGMETKTKKNKCRAQRCRMNLQHWVYSRVDCVLRGPFQPTSQTAQDRHSGPACNVSPLYCVHTNTQSSIAKISLIEWLDWLNSSIQSATSRRRSNNGINSQHIQ